MRRRFLKRKVTQTFTVTRTFTLGFFSEDEKLSAKDMDDYNLRVMDQMLALAVDSSDLGKLSRDTWRLEHQEFEDTVTGAER